MCTWAGLSAKTVTPGDERGLAASAQGLIHASGDMIYRYVENIGMTAGALGAEGVQVRMMKMPRVVMNA